MNYKKSVIAMTLTFVTTLYGCGGGSSNTPSRSATDPTESTDVTTLIDVSNEENINEPDITVPDITVPEIILKGDSLTTLQFGDLYVDQGVITTDNSGIIPEVIISGEVNTNSLGSYEITYTATDGSGNESSTSRTVNVIDTVAPQITLSGNDEVIYLGSDYSDQLVSADDNVDGDISEEVVIEGTVDIDRVGVYLLHYSVTDSSGNASSILRSVNVKSPNNSFSTIDADLNLMEGSYKHRFRFSFNEVEPVRKILNVSILGTSSAEELVDFKLLTTTIDAPGGSTGFYIDLEMIDDRLSEGEEHIDLLISDGLHNTISTLNITLDDRTAAVENHNDISSSVYSPTAIAIHDDLYVLGEYTIERYNLVTETTISLAESSESLQGTLWDSIEYNGNIYIFSNTTLYMIDQENNKYIAVSRDAPVSLRWTSEIQVYENQLYIVGGLGPSGFVSESVLVYDFETGDWDTVASVNNPRYGAATAIHDNTLYIFGGGAGSKSAEYYNFETDIWVETPGNDLLGEGVNFDTAINIGEYVLITKSAPPSLHGTETTILRFDPTDRSYTDFTVAIDTAQFRDSFTYKGRVYVVGGNTVKTTDGQRLVSYYIGD